MTSFLVALAIVVAFVGPAFVLERKLPGGPAAMVARMRSKRIGAQDVPFLLEAYREIDAMGLNGPRMAPEMPHGDQRNGYLTPGQRLILAGHHPVLPAPVDPLAGQKQAMADAYPVRFDRPMSHGRLGRVANERYDRLGTAAYLRARAHGAPAIESRKFVSDVGDVEVRYAYRNGEWKTIWLPQEVAEYPPAREKALRDAKFKLDCEDIGVVPGPLS